MKVAITDASLITAFGDNIDINWQNILSGNTAIKQIKRFDSKYLPINIAATIDFYEESYASSYELTERLTYEAIKNLNIKNSDLLLALPPMEINWPARKILIENGYEAALYKAKSYKSLFEMLDVGNIAKKMKSIFGFQNDPIIINTACASGTTAINLAAEQIRLGIKDKITVVAADGSINPESITRFAHLGTLSQEGARPFSSNRNGFVMAEGAAALVLENYENAKIRNAKILAVISGIGDSIDNYHRTRPSPDGMAAILAMRKAIKDAKLNFCDIDAINAHATGTIENDKTELLAIETVFKNKVPMITANKSMIGHTLTAAGTIEAVLSILSIQHKILPKVMNYDGDKAYIAKKNVYMPSLKHILSNSFGFGGQNSSVIISEY